MILLLCIVVMLLQRLGTISQLSVVRLFLSVFRKINMTNPIVEISNGKLKGQELKTLNNKQYYAFKGIPFAKPPVGPLRFSVPQTPDPWEGVRDATKDCNICAQFDKTSGAVVGNEDCLYLNVYTGALPGQGGGEGPRPVMVFVHGGGFVFGNGTDQATHGPDYLLEKDIVMVSFNYRLGILGFLCLDHPDAPGNMGLRDQVQALKWVQKNINKFGGDPNNVTVFGVSAGGASIEFLLLSPMAKGLFHKALMQSGSSLLHWAWNDNMKGIIMKIPQIKEANTKDGEQILKVLKDLPYKDLIAASMVALEDDNDWKGGIHFGFVPTIEKPGNWEPFLEQDPYGLLCRGEFTRVPILSGFCSREGLLLRAFAPHKLEQLKRDKIFLEYLPFKIDDDQKLDLEAKLKAVYLNSESHYGEDDEYAVDFFSDVDFIGGIHVSAALLSAKNDYPVYLYEFSYSGRLNYIKEKMGIKSPGACHGDDGGYIVSSALLPKDISDMDKSVREQMVTMFTNFAKSGNPIPSMKPAQAPAGPRCLRMGEELSVADFAYPLRGQLFEQLFRGQYAPK